MRCNPLNSAPSQWAWFQNPRHGGQGSRDHRPHPYRHQTLRTKNDTRATRADKLPLKLAHSILSRRFSILAKKENSPITSGNAYNYDLFKFTKIGGISVDAKDHNWQAALPVLEQELRRAIQHGFTEAELEEIKANLINSYELSVKAEPSRKTNDLASSLARHVHKDAVFSTPADDLAILQENISSITPETCHQCTERILGYRGHHLSAYHQ